MYNCKAHCRAIFKRVLGQLNVSWAQMSSLGLSHSHHPLPHSIHTLSRSVRQSFAHSRVRHFTGIGFLFFTSLNQQANQTPLGWARVLFVFINRLSAEAAVSQDCKLCYECQTGPTLLVVLGYQTQLHMLRYTFVVKLSKLNSCQLVQKPSQTRTMFS